MNNQIPEWLAVFMRTQQQLTEGQQTANGQMAQAIRELQNLVANPPAANITVQQSAVPAAQSDQLVDEAKPRHSQPHLDPFTGEDLTLYPQFKSLLKAKLRIDAKAIGSKEERLWYGYGRLAGKAQTRIHPWMDYAEGKTEEFTEAKFLEQLDVAFADPQAQERAITKLNKIRQGKQSFREFLSEFEETLLKADGWDWVDRVKIGYLKAALSKELRDRLVTVKLPDTFKEYCDEVRQIADNMLEMDEINRRTARHGSNRQLPKATDQRTDTMEWEPTQTTSINASKTASRAKWVSREEIERRRTTGDCLRCGKTGHRIRDCKYRPPQRPAATDNQNVRVAAARKAPVATVEEATDEESASEAEN
jgi:hypothetical protein